MLPRLVRTTLAGCAAAAAVVVTAALATPPTVVERQIDRTFPVPADPELCPFPFVVHSEGLRTETTHYDKAGNWTRLVILLREGFKVTYSNPASGKILTTALAGPVIVEPYDAEHVLVTVNGNDGHFTAPGIGQVYSSVGRLQYLSPAAIFPQFFPEEILFSAGQQEPNPFPAVCAALA
jgi:hypothetical protein